MIAAAFAVPMVNLAWADEPTATPSITWQTDYSPAKVEAANSRKWLVVWFHHPSQDSSRLEADLFAEPAIAQRIHAKFVPVKVPLDVLYQGKLSPADLMRDEKPSRLVDHPAFAELRGGPGLAIIDQTDAASPHFGFVVSIYPLDRGNHTAAKLGVLLDLPAGSLPQRTLIYAVRTHPDKPASATGDPLPLLAQETQKHAIHQASINLQGHHGWEQRFHSINARLPVGQVSFEVCAESWPGQTLLDAAEECVDSWRQSSGHWNQVSRQAEDFGYDMRRGTNGVWYAAGIFARRR